jgi:hypothetical protein
MIAPRPTSIARNLLANAALVVASCVLTVALLSAAGELVLRWHHGAVPPGPPAEWNVYHERRGWALRPGRYAYFDVKAARRVDVAINELGLRNGPLAAEPGAGLERITVLGDSFVFGAAVNQDDTITARLQALAGSSFQVVNVAVPGYGTGQQYRLIEDLQATGYRLGGKVVIAFFTNDIQDNLGLQYSTLARNRRQPAFSIDAAGRLQQTPPERARASMRREAGGWLERSLFVSFLRYQVEVLLVSYPGLIGALEGVGLVPELPRTPGVIAGWYGAEWQAAWSVTEGLLQHLVGLLRAAPESPEVFIAFIPSPFQVEESFRRVVAASAESDPRYARFLSDPERPQRSLQAAAMRLGVPFIDLTPALRQAAAGSLVYFPREGHFNEAGCAIAARVIFEQVIKKDRAMVRSADGAAEGPQQITHRLPLNQQGMP